MAGNSADAQAGPLSSSRAPADPSGTRGPAGPTTANHALDELTTRVYLAILRQKDATRALLVAQGMTGELVDQALQSLLGRGLILQRGDGVWLPVAPDVALPAYAAELERQARGVRASAHELAEVFYAAHGREQRSDQGVHVLSTVDELHSATADIVASARTSVAAMRDVSTRTRRLFGVPLAAHRERGYSADGQPLEFRSTYVVDVLDLPGARDVLAARVEGGESIRFVPRAPFSAVVVDDTAAVVDVSAHDETGAGSLLVRSRALVLAISATVEQAWRLGSPLHRAVQDSPLDDRDQQILTLLAAGASDTTIARQIGISQRTVERRMRALMDRLGARTRFQAGIAATGRRWV
jgi:DNA-binding NarL/FixJ family response regulator